MHFNFIYKKKEIFNYTSCNITKLLKFAKFICAAFNPRPPH